ncbi:MAG TPA: VWA domain-containing protein [Pyrinomonadaceae bacterium]|nr:VWA domain-containing protein [Pyrinomonadaceae bacterium]
MRNLAGILLIIFIISGYVFSQNTDDEVIKVNTSLVTVPTKVTDRNDKSITDLKLEDFRLFENGVEQEIVAFEDSSAPFTIALLLDVSDSTRFKIFEIKAAALKFLENLKPKDRVMIFTFDQRLNLIADDTAENLQKVQNSILLTQSGGGTSLYDSIETVIKEHLRKINRKKAMIIFTDGIDTTSNKSDFTNSLKIAQEAGVLTFPIQYSTLEDADKFFGTSQVVTIKGEPLAVAYKRGTQYLNFLAENTGGDFYFAESPENLSKTFAKIALQLSQIYNLSYYPDTETKSGKKRKIKVAVNRPKVSVQTRKVYVLQD